MPEIKEAVETTTRLSFYETDDQDHEWLGRRQKNTPHSWELVLGVALVSAWVCMFAAGTFVATASYREAVLSLPKDISFFDRLSYMAVIILCYTITNLFFLAVISSCLGCMTCRWRVTGRRQGLLLFYAELHPKRVYLAAILRGFFLYLTVISGFLVLSTEDAIVNVKFGQYIRIAGLTSIFGFLVGYDPQIAYRLMGKVNDIANVPLETAGKGR